MVHLLLHICCGPCSLMPVQELRQQGYGVQAYFFNPNIHPQQEYDLRQQSAIVAANKLGIEILLPNTELAPPAWIKSLGGITSLGERCRICYQQRLDATAKAASEGGFACFSSSLLYSRYQNQEAIVEAGQRAGQRHGVEFLAKDFRPFWQQGIDLSQEWNLYRQKWCGCILSMAESEKFRILRRKTKS